MSTVTFTPNVSGEARPPVDMSTKLGAVTVPDPVFTASGCVAAGQELA